MESPLNSWFRQQGGTNRIPSLSSYNNYRKSTSNIYGINQTSYNNNNSVSKKLPNLIKTNSQTKSDSSHVNSYTNIKNCTQTDYLNDLNYLNNFKRIKSLKKLKFLALKLFELFALCK